MSDSIRRKYTEELSEDFVRNDVTKGQIIAHMKNLKNNQDWQAVVHILKDKLKVHEDDILNNDQLNGEELNRQRDRRDLLLWFINLPSTIIEYHKTIDIVSDEQDALDPFEKAKEEKIDNLETNT